MDKLENQTDTTSDTLNNELAVFGGGCFWCTEAFFSELDGVIKVTPGYTGGDQPNPKYDEVCTGETGHAEVVQIEYNPSKISYEDLLQVFFATHDPTTPNQQGHDIGTQYRSAIFYIGEHQKATAEDFIDQLENENVFDKPIVTKLLPLKEFYEAENYHHNYFKVNSNVPYCQIIIRPKLENFRQKFKNLLK